MKGVDTRKKRREREFGVRTEDYWFPKRTLKAIRETEGRTGEEWLQERLPRLIARIMSTYEEQGWIDHIEGRDLPSKEATIQILEGLFTIIFPGHYGRTEPTKSDVKRHVEKTLHSTYDHLVKEVERSLKYLCHRVSQCPLDFCRQRAEVVVTEFLERIPEIRIALSGDVQAAYDGDPAARSTDEVILSYPVTYAIATYRIAHELHMREVPFIPRIMTEHAHSITGIDIHPGSKIGKNFFIDHGTGVVIGETAVIGDNVRIYQGVTLGAMSFPRDAKGRLVKGGKRHPTIEDNVIIYSGATILGGKTVIGKNAVIGGNVWITSSIPSETKVVITPPDISRMKLSKKEN